jgi:pyruvate,water dikinase
MRQQLSDVVVPSDVADAIAAALMPDPGDARAVRSSATVEDLPEASFAGQHDSFLNVRGREAVVAAVKNCWLSLFSERAILYRMRTGVPPGRAQMAVIVQQLIEADAAGVMFTTNPAGGPSDTILIEAAFGLGEAVVQGKVAPDRIEVSRSGLRVVRRDTGLKRVRFVAAKDGVCEQPLAAEKAGAPALEDEGAARLAGLGLEVERVLGGPLDIEWCARGGEIQLLQARAVTALPQGRPTSFEDRQVWTNANAGEGLPDVVTPMTWSLIRLMFRDVFDGVFRVCGIRIKDDQLFGLIAGRAYFNFNTICAFGRRVPGLRDRGMEHFMGGHQDALVALKQIRFSEADLPRIEIRLWKAALGLPTVVLGFLFLSPRRGRAMLGKVRRFNEELARIEPGPLSDGELLAAIRRSFAAGEMRGSKLLGAMGVFGLDNALLFALCERWPPLGGRGTANRLLAGVGGLEDAAAGHDLWLLAEEAAREPEIKSVLQGERAFSAFAARLEDCRGGQAFRARWDAFMLRHGHHARGEIELFNPRWSECPDFLMDLMRGYVEAINAGHPGPIVRQEALAGERVALTSQCMRGLKNPLTRAIFRHVLNRAQNGARSRENLKSEAIRWLAFLRRFLLELGRRLAARGRLADANDVFFLEIEELQSGFLWDAGTDLRAPVARRRGLYEENLKVTPPAVVIGRFDPRTFAPDAVDSGTKVFHGLGVSAGTATGRARVILRSDAHERVLPGEILVAPFTDPGWTPYFVAAAGIVMDLGGMLSHGSIVAREYGIPAVVNVGPATQIIRTGQWIEVDANRGVVRVLDFQT